MSHLVGYVVGLGDRHVQNILVDCNTAELVHIDLGKRRIFLSCVNQNAFDATLVIYSPRTGF